MQSTNLIVFILPLFSGNVFAAIQFFQNHQTGGDRNDLSENAGSRDSLGNTRSSRAYESPALV